MNIDGKLKEGIRNMMISDSIEANKVKHNLQSQWLQDNKKFIFSNTAVFNEITGRQDKIVITDIEKDQIGKDIRNLKFKKNANLDLQYPSEIS